MDYVVGNVAALLSGNVTPNRPKPAKRALTPIKHMQSPNVTPKSEFVDDRSIFLSPTMQKKKAVLKKSPKRIFQNPDLDVTAENEGNSSVTSPKADKVKKHLKNALEANTSLDKSVEAAKPKVKSGKSTSSPSPQKNVEINDSNSYGKENVSANELTPKKKKKQHNNVNNVSESAATAVEVNENEGTPSKKKKQKKNSVSEIPHDNTQNSEVTLDTNASVAATSPKKNKKKRNNSQTAQPEVTEKPSNDVTENNANTTASPKKKNKRRNKSKNKQAKAGEENNTQAAKPDTTKQPAVNVATETSASAVASPKKKNKRRNKSKNKQPQVPPEGNNVQKPVPEPTEPSTDDVVTENNANDATSPSKKKNRKRKKSATEQTQEKVEDEIDQVDGEISPKKTKKKIKVNPNAVTDKDSDSEHDSDDEIESENEENNRAVLQSSRPVADESSDEEEEAPKPKKKKEKVSEEKTETEKPKEINTAEEIKRTLFVGNVPFSKKCKKEIKKIFSKYGEIDSVRIRTVPVKDPSVTPKLAVIKQELHPERSTVNVYVKFNNPRCVEDALAENNTVLNNNHLRVTRSGSTGAEHDPHCSVFVGNVPFGLEDEGLREKFDKCGEIESVRIVRDKKTNAGKGFGYVNFKSKDGVELALALTEEDLTIKNRIMRVKRCTLTTKLQANKKSKFSGPQNRPWTQDRGPPNRNGPQNWNGPPNRGPPNRNGPQNRNGPPNRGPPNRNGPQNRNGPPNRGPPNRNGPSYRNGPQDRNGPPNRQGFQGKNKVSQGNRQRGLQGGNQGGDFQGGAEGQKEGAYRRVMNKRKSQEGGDGPPSKVPRDAEQAPREKKERKEFVGMTAEKKKKKKVDKGQKKKKALSEILTK